MVGKDVEKQEEKIKKKKKKKGEKRNRRKKKKKKRRGANRHQLIRVLGHQTLEVRVTTPTMKPRRKFSILFLQFIIQLLGTRPFIEFTKFWS